MFYVLSDDPSQFQPARFYTVALDVGDGQLSAGDVAFEGVTTLLTPAGVPYASFSLDPEGLALTRDGELILTSEGFANSLIDPFVRRYSLSGDFLGSLPVPQAFLPTADHSSGVRQNLGFESAGTGNTIRLYEVALPGSSRTARKTLLLDPRGARHPARQRRGDDVRTASADGRRSVVPVSGNNFAPAQFTQFLLFALDR